jgi:hypothetical protein
VGHRGQSHYKEQYTKRAHEKVKKQQEDLKKMTNQIGAQSLKLGTYTSKPFNFETTNNEKLKDFKITTKFINDQPKFQSGKD